MEFDLQPDGRKKHAERARFFELVADGCGFREAARIVGGNYLLPITNTDAMEALHQRSFDVEERQQVLEAFGHTAESAFRNMYSYFDLDLWFSRSNLGAATRIAIETWRGTASIRGGI